MIRWQTFRKKKSLTYYEFMYNKNFTSIFCIVRFWGMKKYNERKIGLLGRIDNQIAAKATEILGSWSTGLENMHFYDQDFFPKNQIWFYAEMETYSGSVCIHPCTIACFVLYVLLHINVWHIWTFKMQINYSLIKNPHKYSSRRISSFSLVYIGCNSKSLRYLYKNKI